MTSLGIRGDVAMCLISFRSLTWRIKPTADKTRCGSRAEWPRLATLGVVP
jgi:hypothetical protein